MWRTALASISNFEALKHAWRDLNAAATARSRRTIGTDRVSINDYAIDLTRHLRLLSLELARAKFDFTPLRPQLIPKSNNKMRVICVPTVKDRIVQRSLLNHLWHRYGKHFSNDISYGFVPGRTVQQAVARACVLRGARRWVYKTDIESFFDRIHRDRLRTELRKNVRERSIHDLLFRAIDCEIDDNRRSVRIELSKQNIKRGVGLRQGMPLSPFLSNVVLRRFDLAVTERGLAAIRYADDLIFLSESRAQCDEIHQFCVRELAKYHHTVPPLSSDMDSKTRIYGPAEVADFLGLGIAPRGDKYEGVVTLKQMEKIKTTLLELSNPKELVSRGIRLSSFGAALDSRINGYLNAYESCANFKDIEAQIVAIGAKVKRVLYKEHLKINPDVLSAEARTFLDI